MSVNQHGKIVGQVIRPGVAAPDRKQKRLPTARPQPPTPTAQDIIEISSDEDEDPQPPPKRVLTKRGRHSSPQESDYKAFLSQRDHEIEMLKKREKELERIVASQKKEIETKVIPKADLIEEELTCEICTTILWSPYRFTECGHVFCLCCIIKWFDDTHVRYLNSHPGYTPLSPYFKQVLQRPFAFPRDFSRVSKHVAQHPGPQYTCPSCRAAVTRRPVEDFKVKALVSWFSSVQGIKPPKPRIPPGTGDTVFDGYSLI